MRAAVMRGSELVVTDVPDPQPGPGEVLVKTSLVVFVALICIRCSMDIKWLKCLRSLVVRLPWT